MRQRQGAASKPVQAIILPQAQFPPAPKASPSVQKENLYTRRLQ
jgi:hypothetical protein